MTQLSLFTEEKSEGSFLDSYGLKRPIPPVGFKKWIPEGTPPECPNCGKNLGQVWDGGGFTDAGAQNFLEEVMRQNNLNSYDRLCLEYDGEMIKSHWSRYGTGRCLACSCQFWHDFVQGYKGDSRYIHICYYWRADDLRKV